MKKLIIALTTLTTLTTPLHAADQIIGSFEGDGFSPWKTQGKAFGNAPAAGGTGIKGKPVTNFAQAGFASSNNDDSTAKGSLTSPAFEISNNYLHFLIAGGKFPGTCAAQLIINGKVVRTATGDHSSRLRPIRWDIADYKGSQATIRILDNETAENGYIHADHFVLTDDRYHTFPATGQNIVTTNNLVPSRTHPSIEIPKNSILEIIATHKSHGITAPTALTPTENGDWLITETWRFMANKGIDDNRNRRYWIPEDIAAQTTADRAAMYKRWEHKIPASHYTAHSEKIRRIYSSKNDTTLDANNIFADNFNHPLDGTAAGIFNYRDTTYFACIPHIWALKDTDNDGKSDTRKSLQEGFGVRVSFSGHDLNGFALGPDGRIYATIGDRGFNITTKEGKTYTYPDQGAVLRFDPDGSNMEVVHTGLRNPKEIAFDQFGNGITVDNNSDQSDQARIVYLMQDADSGWRMGHQTLHSFHRTIGLEKRPINMWMQEKMWQPANDDQPAHITPPILNLTNGPSGLTFDPGTGAHPDFKNHFLICDYRGAAAYSEILGFSIAPAGAGMKVTDIKKFNKGAAVTDVEYGFDGNVYITDFIGGWSTHKNGQLLKISPAPPTNPQAAATVAPLIKKGIHTLSTEKLTKLLEHPDLRIRNRAHITLAEKKETQLLSDLLDKFQQENKLIPALHTTWALGIIIRKNKDQHQAAAKLIVTAFNTELPELKAQALKCLAQSPHRFEKINYPAIASLKHPSPRIQAFACQLLASHKHADGHIRLVQFLRDTKSLDPFLRHAATMALIKNSNPNELAQLHVHASDNVRQVAALALRRLKHPHITKFLTDSNKQIAYTAIRAITDQELTDLYPTITALLPAKGSSKFQHALTPIMQRRLIHTAYRAGGIKNAQRLITFASDPNMDKAQRLEAIRLIREWATPNNISHLTGNHAPLEKRDTLKLIPLIARSLPDLTKLEDFIVDPSLALLSHYKITNSPITSKQLANFALNEKLSPLVRSSALAVLSEQDPDTVLTIAPKLATSGIETIAIQSLRSLTKLNKKAATPHLIFATKRKSSAIQQAAWTLLADRFTPETKQRILEALTNLQQNNSPAAIEILAAAKKADNPDITIALQKLTESNKKNPLGTHTYSLFGGNADRGQALFKSHGSAQCMRCHSLGYGHILGGNAAPNLAGVANRLSREELLTSLIEPSAHYSPGYGTITLTFQNNKSITATYISETEKDITIRTGESTHIVDKKQIVSTELTPSAMPSMSNILTPIELRDITAFLAAQTDETGKPTPPEPKIEPLNIAALTSKKPETNGEKLYLSTCSACHQDNGKGIVGAFPPLAKSEWVNGPPENLIRIQLRGLQGPIKVKGQTYDGIMPHQANQTDQEIAAVLTYIRKSFGNNAPPITPAQVKNLRPEATKPPLTAKDLIPPK